MSISDLAAIIASIGDTPGVRFRQGSIVSVASDSTVTVTIAGSTANIAGIKVASSVCPVPGATCWLSTDGRDWIVLATLAPAGPAWATMRQSSAQTINSGAFTSMDWTSRTETQTVGVTIGNSGFTCIVPGLYQVDFNASFTGNNTGQRHAAIYHNGSAEAHGYSTNAPGTSDVCRMGVATMIKLAPGDTVNGAIYQSSGGTLVTNTAAGHNLLRMAWIGPSA